MIKKIDSRLKVEAESIRKVFQASYAVEAKLLDAEDNFPPLKRPLEGFIKSETSFYGFYDEENLTGVMEIYLAGNKAHIQSMVVDPSYFRRGIASKLLQFLFEQFKEKSFTVETGAANGPARTLYERHGFKKVNQWMTEIGIEKVAFEKE